MPNTGVDPKVLAAAYKLKAEADARAKAAADKIALEIIDIERRIENYRQRQREANREVVSLDKQIAWVQANSLALHSREVTAAKTARANALRQAQLNPTAANRWAVEAADVKLESAEHGYNTCSDQLADIEDKRKAANDIVYNAEENIVALQAQVNRIKKGGR